jgi:hypothetical protein
MMRVWKRRSFDTTESWSFLAMLLLISICTFWIASGVYQYRAYQMDMDEASHATRGLDFTAALIHQDKADFWHQLTKPHWYPPREWAAHVWLVHVIRDQHACSSGCTALWLFFFGILLWFYTRQILPGSNPLFYLLPVIFLTADRLHTLYAAQSMLEMPGTLFSFAALFSLPGRSERTAYSITCYRQDSLC